MGRPEEDDAMDDEEIADEEETEDGMEGDAGKADLREKVRRVGGRKGETEERWKAPEDLDLADLGVVFRLYLPSGQ